MEKVIDDKNASVRARIAENKNRQYLDAPNFDELRDMVTDENGNYDIYEAYALAGMEPPAEVLADVDLSYFESHFTAINNCIEPHILGNGERAIYSTSDGEQWKLNEGEIIRLHIFADINRLEAREFKGKGVLEFGYFKDGEHIAVQEIKMKDEAQIEFAIPEDGEYDFYLFCPGSSDIIIEWISIKLL